MPWGHLGSNFGSLGVTLRVLWVNWGTVGFLRQAQSDTTVQHFHKALMKNKASKRQFWKCSCPYQTFPHNKLLLLKMPPKILVSITSSQDYSPNFYFIQKKCLLPIFIKIFLLLLIMYFLYEGTLGLL